MVAFTHSKYTLHILALGLLCVQMVTRVADHGQLRVQLADSQPQMPHRGQLKQTLL